MYYFAYGKSSIAYVKIENPDDVARKLRAVKKKIRSLHLELCLHKKVGESSRPDPEAEPSVAEEGSIAALLVFKVGPCKESGKVKCAQGNTDEEWQAMSVTVSSV
jgi:hypothetical protein